MKLTIAIETEPNDTPEAVTEIRLRVRRGVFKSRPGVASTRRRTVTTQAEPVTEWAEVVPLRRVG